MLDRTDRLCHIELILFVVSCHSTLSLSCTLQIFLDGAAFINRSGVLPALTEQQVLDVQIALEGLLMEWNLSRPFESLYW